MAIDFLKETIQNTKDPAQKKIYYDHYLKTLTEIKSRKLEKSIKEFESITGSKPSKLEDLTNYGIDKSDLFDPYGNKYSYNNSTGVITSRGHKRIDLFSDSREQEKKHE